jgi:hypothetical protein
MLQPSTNVPMKNGMIAHIVLIQRYFTINKNSSITLLTWFAKQYDNHIDKVAARVGRLMCNDLDERYK